MALGGIGILAWIALAAADGLPPAQIPIRIDFEAPAGCADGDAFYAGIVARMNRVRRAGPGENAMRVVVRLTRTGDKVHGELHLSGERGESDTRRVDGATCEEVVQVLSLTAALAIDPSAGFAGPAASEKPAAVPQTPTAPRPAAAPVAATPAPLAPSPPREPPPPRLEPPPAPAPTPQSPASPSVGAPPVAAAPLPPSAPSATFPSPRASGFELGAALVAAEVVSPSFSAGAAVSGRIATTTRDGLTPSAALALLFLPSDFTGSGDDIGIRFTALALTGCPGWALRARVELEPCARATVGLLTATDHSVTNPRSVDRSWWSAGALLRATTRLGASGVTLELTGGIDVPLVKRSFIVTTVPPRSVGQTPTVSPTLSLGVGHSL